MRVSREEILRRVCYWCSSCETELFAWVRGVATTSEIEGRVAVSAPKVKGKMIRHEEAFILSRSHGTELKTEVWQATGPCMLINRPFTHHF